MAIIIELSKRVKRLGYKLGDEVNVIELDLDCPFGLIYKCSSKKTRDLWFRKNELKV